MTLFELRHRFKSDLEKGICQKNDNSDLGEWILQKNYNNFDIKWETFDKDYDSYFQQVLFKKTSTNRNYKKINYKIKKQ